MVPLHFKLLFVTHSIPGYHDKREPEMKIWSKTNLLPYFAISSLETQPMNLILTRNAAKTLSTNFGYNIMVVCLLLVVLCFTKIRETNMMTPRKIDFFICSRYSTKMSIPTRLPLW